jgi:NAD(P)-dependent dehydrogenase (short-subunit alcohol dehydrogenase family)
MVLTDRVKQRFGETSSAPPTPQAEAMRKRFQEHPFAVGQPEDIARVALFLASDESRKISGMIRSIKPAGEIVRDIMEEAIAVLEDGLYSR